MFYNTNAFSSVRSKISTVIVVLQNARFYVEASLPNQLYTRGRTLSFYQKMNLVLFYM